MRDVLIGVGHTQQLGRFATSANLTAGYTFNHFVQDDSVAGAYRRAGETLLNVEARNSPVAKPEVSLWYDVAKRVGVSGFCGIRAHTRARVGDHG
jgi:hypothetical protein